MAWLKAGAVAKALALAPALAGATPAAAGPVDRWSGEISEASLRFGVPADWIRRVMQAESGGRLMLGGRPITSPAGAMGLMQLMPRTWLEMRAAHGLGADPHDPHDNIQAGAAYLRRLYDRFGYPGLFAAYNAGPGRYGEYLTRARRLPAETRAYVAALGAPRPAAPAPRPNGERPTALFAFRSERPAGAAAASPDLGPSALFVALDQGPVDREPPPERE
jgi:soluble lytic murein transglycosylase-like protein